MALIVAHASVLLKALLTDREAEKDADLALALWSRVAGGEDELVQPPHWLAEVGAVLARLSPQTVERDLLSLHAMNVSVVTAAEVYRIASRLSVQLDHHLFDTLYHAVAVESESATLVTADERYYRKASAYGHIVRLADHSS